MPLIERAVPPQVQVNNNTPSPYVFHKYDHLIGVTRSFRSFSQGLDEVKNARIFAGIHFRFSCDDGQAVGDKVARWALDHALLPVH